MNRQTLFFILFSCLLLALAITTVDAHNRHSYHSNHRNYRNQHAKRSKLQSARGPGDSRPVGDALKSEVISKFRIQYLELAQREVLLSGRALPLQNEPLFFIDLYLS